MQKERKQLEELFQKYQQGLVSEEEKVLIARWLIQMDVIKQLTDKQLQARQALSQSDLKNHFFPKESPSAKITRFPGWIRSVAASLLILSAITGFFYFNNKSHHLAISPVAFRQTTTETGEMKIITLTDGTKITLNNESRLKYPITFNGTTREVFLTGEAFFDVAHNPKKPFKVYTDKVNVQVLGTSFNVKAYREDEELSVSVATGKVGVIPTAAKTKAYILLPGDRLAYNHSTESFSQSRVSVVNISAWQKGKFIFKNETLENITRQLERCYKVKFSFNNKSLLAKQISLKVKNQSVNTVMKALSISGEFRYKIEDNKVTVW